ncbi:MAG: glycosyltransferase family 4 protein [Deltaproteobacteria bacterium]|nr:glycosyltransferase family 4 protein [Deltaproteobacteria bacterium]
MRIALVIERFEAGSGGAEAVAWTIAHGLARRGDQVEVIARRADDSPEVAVRRVAVPRGWQPLRVLGFSAAAARAIAGSRADCVLSFSRTRRQHVYRAGAGSHADYMERRYGRLHHAWRFSPRHAVLLAAERRIFRDPRQRVLCLSEMVRSEIQRRYQLPAERLTVVRNGVDLERFHPRNRAGSGAKLRARLGASNLPVWLFAGSGFKRKGLDTALRALARSGPSASELWVAGRDAPARWQRLARRLGVASRVSFLGFRADLAPVYAAADALFLPSRYDAFGNVCLEAAAAGLPVVTSGAVGAAELLRDSGGVVADPEDVTGFARELERLQEPALRARRAADSRKVAETLSWDRQIDVLRTELERAVA